MQIESRPNLTSDIIYEAWRLSFLEDEHWIDPEIFTPIRRGGLSHKQKKKVRPLIQFENAIIKLSEKYGYKVKLKDISGIYDNSSRGNPIPEALATALNAIKSEKGFLEFLHKGHTNGIGRVIPSFIARHFLFGLALYEKDKVGQGLIRSFMSKTPIKGKSSNFSKSCDDLITKYKFIEPWSSRMNEIVNAVCSSRAERSDITSWAKQQKAYFLDILEFAGERKGGKRNPKKRATIVKELRKLSHNFKSRLAGTPT